MTGPGAAAEQRSDALAGFDRWSFTAESKARDVYSIGEGPAVIVISEIPGITPLVAAFGRRVAAIGCTAILPHLFGVPGAAPTVANSMKLVRQACISREFATFALNRTSPITTWLSALAREAHGRYGGPGVGVVGMCLTGGFALAMMVDDVVVAPVLSQPSLPFPLTKARRSDLGISREDLRRVRERCAVEDVCVIGLRFSGDRTAPAERFARLQEELGDHFLAVEIDSSPGNPEGYRKQAHSVLTEDLKDVPGSATADAPNRCSSCSAPACWTADQPAPSLRPTRASRSMGCTAAKRTWPVPVGP
jgi:dienelactone hydrolase